MKKLTIKTLILLVLSCLFAFSLATTALAQEPDPDPTLLEVIQTNPKLSTLSTAITEAGLEETLLDPNANLTILAPTNAAFDDQALLADQDALEDVLLYHVISGTLSFTQITSESSVTTLQGGEILVGLIPNGTSPLPGFNNDVEVVAINVTASNGTIHIIDGVLMPLATAVTLSGVQASISSTMVIFIAVLSLAAVTPLATRR